MKVVILVDALVNKGGIERIVLEHARDLNADIIAGKYNPDTTFEEFKKYNIRTLINSKKHSPIDTVKIWYSFNTLNLKDYDIAILHGAGSLNAAGHIKTLWYCNSPSRYLYDLYEDELKRRSLLGKIFFIFTSTIMRIIDQGNVSRINGILVNSKNVQGRLKRFYNLEPEVYYPFVDRENFKYIETGDFYLSTARLDPMKRVDLIVNAFKKMPDKKLIIVSDGPDKERIKNLIKDSNNITYLGPVSNSELFDLCGRCMCMLYLSYKEDLGMTALESMSAGKPFIATNDGGFKETVLHKKTGYLVDDPTDPNQVIEAVRWMSEERVKMLKEACEERSKLFDVKAFNKKIRDEIEDINNNTSI